MWKHGEGDTGHLRSAARCYIISGCWVTRHAEDLLQLMAGRTPLDIAILGMDESVIKYKYMYVYMYIYMYVYICIHIYVRICATV